MATIMIRLGFDGYERKTHCCYSFNSSLRKSCLRYSHIWLETSALPQSRASQHYASLIPKSFIEQKKLEALK